MSDIFVNQLFRLAPLTKPRMQPRRVLFVQTDWEMGLARMAKDLEECGHTVFKVALNFSDNYFRLKKVPTFPFRAPIEEFEDWLEDLIDQHEIDTLFVYNPFRPYNRIACEIADRRGLGVVQFDQGLLRPLHVSVFPGSEFPFEQIATLWNDPESHGKWEAPTQPAPALSVSTARKNFLFGFSVLITLLFSFRFPHYRDQKKMSLTTHLSSALLFGYRFLVRSGESFTFVPKITGEWSGKFFLVPLQLEHDVQIQVNSPFATIDEMIDQVADSFLQHADPDDRLIFKIHPLDRGYRTFMDKYVEMRKKLGKDRVFLVDRVPLTLLLDRAKGVITVNSTVGLTALRHLTPVKTLGTAFYDLDGLTFQGGLDDFWSSHPKPGSTEVKQFINLLESTIQGRGTLSRRCYKNAGHAGILWPGQFGKTFGLDYFLYPQSQVAEVEPAIDSEVVPS